MADEKAEEAIYAYHVNLIRRKTHEGKMIAWDKLNIDGNVVVEARSNPHIAIIEATTQAQSALKEFTGNDWVVERLVVERSSRLI